MIQKKNTSGAVEEYRSKRREEKKIHRQRKREWEKNSLKKYKCIKTGTTQGNFTERLIILSKCINQE
ncbi:hypothetical protein C0J52_10106 [Blattella germanica]|nr:hypothetical protein C0J52_10106 [Blattella germanica]